MDQWEIKFFPEMDERDSPYEFLSKNFSKKEIATLMAKLERISRLSQEYWQDVVTIKPLKPKAPNYELFQLTSGDFRVYLTPNKDLWEIVVVFICRKDAQKARGFNLKRAHLNASRYFDEVSGGGKRNG